MRMNGYPEIDTNNESSHGNPLSDADSVSVHGKGTYTRGERPSLETVIVVVCGRRVAHANRLWNLMRCPPCRLPESEKSTARMGLYRLSVGYREF